MDRVHVTDVIAYLAQGSECKRETAYTAQQHPSAEFAHSVLTSIAHSPPFLGRQHKFHPPPLISKKFLRICWNLGEFGETQKVREIPGTPF